MLILVTDQSCLGTSEKIVKLREEIGEKTQKRIP